MCEENMAGNNNSRSSGANKINSKVSALIKKTGLQLVPFFLAVIAYFSASSFRHKGVLWSTILKCLPIYMLVLFVLMQGLGALKRNSYYNLRLMIGLAFSSVGDWMLNVNKFEMGVVGFAIAQIFFITCFGFTPRKFRLGVTLFAFVLIVNLILLNFNQDIVKIVLIYIYSNLLITMTWRGVSRMGKLQNYGDLPKLMGAIGSVSFLISDSLLAANMFVVKSDIMTIFVMITYYLAEVGIALTVVDMKTHTNE